MAQRKRRVPAIKGASLKTGFTKATNVAIKNYQKKRKVSPERLALLSEVKKLQRNAGSKIGRITRKGVDIRNTKFDPREKPSKLNNMTLRELRGMHRKLSVFNDRRTQFVPGANGSPIPAAKFKAYKDLENQQNMRALERATERGGIRLPENITIAERTAMMADESLPRMEGGFTKAPFSVTNRESSQFPSVEALDRIIEGQRKVLRRGHLPKEIRAAKEGLLKMVDEFGDPELAKLASSLTNNQIDILWFDYKYNRGIVTPYIQAKMLAAQGREAEIADALEDDLNDIYEAFRWARTIPKTAERKSQGKGKSRS